jgi:putative sterol carrier protein
MPTCYQRTKEKMDPYLRSGGMLPAQVQEKLGAGFNKIVQFEIAEDSTYYVTISDGKYISINTGKHPNPDLTIYSDRATFQGVMDRTVQAPEAIQQGRIRVQGSMADLMKLMVALPW